MYNQGLEWCAWDDQGASFLQQVRTAHSHTALSPSTDPVTHTPAPPCPPGLSRARSAAATQAATALSSPIVTTCTQRGLASSAHRMAGRSGAHAPAPQAAWAPPPQPALHALSTLLICAREAPPSACGWAQLGGLAVPAHSSCVQLLFCAELLCPARGPLLALGLPGAAPPS